MQLLTCYLDSDDDSTDSSSHFDPVDADFTGSSWENDGVFPQDIDDPTRSSRLPHAPHPSNGTKGMYRSNSNTRLPPFHPIHPPSSDIKVPAQLPNGEPRSVSSSSTPDKSNGHTNGTNNTPHQPEVNGTPQEVTSRSARLSELQHMGMQLYDQCCRSQAGNWTWVSRFLPRFV